MRAIASHSPSTVRSAAFRSICLELGEGHLDGVEVGRVGRQEAEFAAHGIGAMAWETYDEGKPDEGERLIVIVPHPERGAPYHGKEWIQVYPMHAPNNWAQPGPVNGWDGNREAPTFNPSIDCSNGGKRPGWHSYIVAGRVCDTNKRPIDREA